MKLEKVRQLQSPEKDSSRVSFGDWAYFLAVWLCHSTKATEPSPIRSKQALHKRLPWEWSMIFGPRGSERKAQSQVFVLPFAPSKFYRSIVRYIFA
jgi:hypothetical protein